MNDMEMGGYLPLEIGNLGQCDNEAFKDISEKDKIRFNAARFAICYAVLEGNFRKIFIPLYMCKSVGEALTLYGIRYETYSIDKNFMPEIKALKSDECIMICNYYGIQGYRFYDLCCEQYRNVIFDDTQAFYQHPILNEHIYNIYSARKFVGCIDGAYLIKKDIKKKEFLPSESWSRGGICSRVLKEGRIAHIPYIFRMKKELHRKEYVACQLLHESICPVLITK